MELDEPRAYNQSMEIGEIVWNIVFEWNNFANDTIGKQLVRAVDPIVSNLSKGFGKYHYKEAINFGYYSSGSLFKTKTWLTKAHNRKLIMDDIFTSLIDELNTIGKMLNKYIKSIGPTNYQRLMTNYQ